MQNPAIGYVAWKNLLNQRLRRDLQSSRAIRNVDLLTLVIGVLTDAAICRTQQDGVGADVEQHLIFSIRWQTAMSEHVRFKPTHR
jgi:hypothetical protein